MRLLVLLATCCSLALVSCGDDEEPAGGGSGADSGGGNGDWVAEVNRVCRQNQEDTQQIAAEVQEDVGTGAKATAEIIDRSTESSGELLGDLREVETPDDVSDDYSPSSTRSRTGSTSIRSSRTRSESARRTRSSRSSSRRSRARRGRSPRSTG